MDEDGFMTTTTDQGRQYSLRIDEQARNAGPLSLKEAITTQYGAAI